MEKIIKIGDKEFRAKSNAASLILYKAAFHRDALKDMMKIGKSLLKTEKKLKEAGLSVDDDDAAMELASADDFDFDLFIRFLWVFSKAADKSIPPLEQWLETFDVPPFAFAVEALPQAMDMLSSNAQTMVKTKKK